MIIRNNSFQNKNNFHKDDKEKYIEERDNLRKSIDNLENRYKRGEMDISKFKEVANNYAKEHERLNKIIDNNN